MKKLIISILIICAAFSVQAQYNFLDYGVRASLGVSNLEGNSKIGASINAGLFIQVDVFDRIGLGFDLMPGLKTGKYEQDAGTEIIDHKYTFFAMDGLLYFYFPISDNLSIEFGKNVFSTHLSEKYKVDGKIQEGYSTSEVKGGLIAGLKIQLSSSSELGIRYFTSKITETAGEGYLQGGRSGVFNVTFAQDINW